jgi:hypothetical protein
MCSSLRNTKREIKKRYAKRAKIVAHRGIKNSEKHLPIDLGTTHFGSYHAAKGLSTAHVDGNDEQLAE